ncbi:MAG: signal peptidase I [Candidatus Aenigmatarchaeota archaeon]
MKLAKDIVEIIVAFVVAWIFLQGLGFAFGTRMPITSVVSESMEPILNVGDLVVVVAPQNLKAGDIILFDGFDGIECRQKGPIIHRIIKINDDGSYETKGDNNVRQLSCEHNITKEKLVGKVVLASPLLGYPRLALYAVGI